MNAKLHTIYIIIKLRLSNSLYIEREQNIFSFQTTIWDPCFSKALYSYLLHGLSIMVGIMILTYLFSLPAIHNSAYYRACVLKNLDEGILPKVDRLPKVDCLKLTIYYSKKNNRSSSSNPHFTLVLFQTIFKNQRRCWGFHKSW